MRKDQELLLQAAREGDSAVVRRILVHRRSGPLASLRRGPGANVQDSTGFTPLHHAALNGHTEIVSLLLAADASPFIKDGKGATPLHLAAWNGHEDIVAMLLTHHPLKDDLDVDIRANSGDTPLHYSAQFGHTGAVIQLLKRNADPQAKNNKHETPLDLAAQFGRFDVVEKLIRHSPGIVDPFKASRHRGMLFPSTPLHRASNNGHGSVVMILLKAGVDPNCRTAQGTALHVAATFGKLDAARALLERGADPRIPDSAGRNVIDLLSTLPEKLAMNMEMLIHKYSTVKGLVECLPPIPIMDSPDYEHAVPIGAYERNGTERLQTDGNSMKLSNIASSRSIYKKPQKFVKKIATKYFGVKFNSAPNISQHGLESEIGGKCIPKSPTLSIGNSRFFNFKSKSNETTVICNDEFDTISLDGFMFDRSNQGNSSNRSFPGGLKNSLPNILEKPEDDVLSDASQESSSSFENITAIYHPDKHSNQELHFETIIETELESLEARDEDESNLEEKPTNQVVLNNKEDARQYVNVTIQKIIARPAPVPAARSNVPLPKPDIVNIDRESKLYENIVIKEAVKPEPAKRTIKPDGTAEDLIPTVVPTPKPKIMAPSLSFESNDSDEENFEDLMMSKKSSSFSKRRKPTNWTFMEKTKTKQIERTKSMKSESSTTTEVLTLEDVDCSSDISTLAYKRQSSTLPRSSFYSEKTLTPQAEFRTLPRSIPREISENYHIKGTGKCIYQGPTLNEFMNAMNRDTLRPETLNNRFSYSAICFCRPVNPIKHSKSEGDLLENVEIDNVNLDSYLNSLRNSLNSFKCYCDVDYSCSLNHKRAGQFAVYYSAAKRSYSFPNLTDLATKVDIDLITASTENDTSLTFGALSDTSTLRSLDSNTLDSKRSVIFDDDTIGNKRSAKSRPTVDPSVQIGLAELYTKSLANDKAQSELSGPVEVEIVTDVSGSVHSCGYGRDSDEFSLSSAASSHHQDCNKVSPTPPKKPPRRNLSVSPTHVNVQPTSPCYNNSYEHMNKSAAHARSQDDLDDIQANKHYFKLGTSVDHCIDSKYFADYEQRSTKPVPNPRPSLKQPVAISAMYENVVIKEQNPKRKLRRNYENFEPRRFSIEDPYSQGDRVEVPSSPTHYEQPPTPEHPPPSAVQAERCIHERIRPLSQEYKRRSCGYGLRDSWTETERWLMRDSWADDQNTGSRDSWSETRANTYDSWSDEQRGVLRTGSSNSLASSATTDNAIDEYVAAAPFGGLFKGSTTQLESAGLKPMPAERPRTLRKLRNVYEPADVDTEIPTAMDVSVRRRTNSNQSVGDKSLSILSPFDEQEEWAKISKIMESIGTKLVRESVFVSELEQEFQSRLGLSCSDTSLSPSIASSIGHWLYGVGLVEYETVFQTHGYDDLDFINGLLDATDLREMGVREEEHQKILDAITHLPQKIADVIHVQNKNKYEEQNTSVDEWLRQINLDQYSETFRKHLYLDMERVRNIWEVELTAVLEIQKFGHRKRILRSVSGENNGPAQRIEDTIDLNNIKNNIQSLKENHREKTPEPQTKPLPILNIPTMGTETLKRSKKNRPAPQPPKPSDLEIRAPSELLVGVPGALETKWRHKPFVLVTGAVTYVANYLGSTVVKELRGTESTKKSIQKLKRSTKEPRDSPDIILSISYRGVKFLNTITKELVCEHEIRNIHCACQDADDLTHFAYITKDLISKCHYCHVFRVATMDQATEVILTLGEAFEVAYQMALREAQLAKAVPKVTKTPTHEPKERNHGRSHSITEIKLNGHQLKIAPIPSSLSNEDFQYSKDGSKGLSYSIKAPIASTEEL